jgi:hypothetical protein
MLAAWPTQMVETAEWGFSCGFRDMREVMEMEVVGDLNTFGLDICHAIIYCQTRRHASSR